MEREGFVFTPEELALISAIERGEKTAHDILAYAETLAKKWSQRNPADFAN
jgi:hypothetical protein